jgi:hypothetical protein
MDMTTTEAQQTEAQYRVTYVQVGRRRTRTVGAFEFNWLCGAWHCGIRVTSYRQLSG